MSREEAWFAAGGAVALLLLLVVVALVALSRLRGEVRDLRTALADVDAGSPSSPSSGTPAVATSVSEVPEATYVITELSSPSEAVEPPYVAQPIDGRLFADIVARETVVRAGGLIHGLRRAVSPEVRNRIRFEMRREVKRARKQRRSDTRAAMRDVAARERQRDAA